MWIMNEKHFNSYTSDINKASSLSSLCSTCKACIHSYILSIINEERKSPLGIPKLASCSESSQRMEGCMKSMSILWGFKSGQTVKESPWICWPQSCQSTRTGTTNSNAFYPPEAALQGGKTHSYTSYNVNFSTH